MKRRIIIEQTAVMNKLTAFAEECGIQVGLGHLSRESAVKTITARLKLAAEYLLRQFGREPALLASKEKMLREKQQRQESAVESLTTRPLHRPDQTPPLIKRAPIHWPRATFIITGLTVLIGLLLASNGIQLSPTAYAAMGISTALLLVSLPVLPSLVRLLLSWSGYGLACTRRFIVLSFHRTCIALLHRRTAKVRMQQAEEELCRKLIEDWKAQAEESLLSVFNYNLERAARAASLLSLDEPTAAPSSINEPKAISVNGIPNRAEPSAYRKVSSATESSPSRDGAEPLNAS